MKIFTFWRSLTSFRVPHGLNLKGHAPERIFVDLFAAYPVQFTFSGH